MTNFMLTEHECKKSKNDFPQQKLEAIDEPTWNSKVTVSKFSLGLCNQCFGRPGDSQLSAYQ